MAKSRTRQAQDELKRQIENCAAETMLATEDSTSKIIKVRIGTTPVRIRDDASIQSKHTGKYAVNTIYDVDEVRNGPGSKSGWGHLMNGDGWIALDFCEII